MITINELNPMPPASPTSRKSRRESFATALTRRQTATARAEPTHTRIRLFLPASSLASGQRIRDSGSIFGATDRKPSDKHAPLGHISPVLGSGFELASRAAQPSSREFDTLSRRAWPVPSPRKCSETSSRLSFLQSRAKQSYVTTMRPQTGRGMPWAALSVWRLLLAPKPSRCLSATLGIKASRPRAKRFA